MNGKKQQKYGNKKKRGHNEFDGDGIMGGQQADCVMEELKIDCAAGFESGFRNDLGEGADMDHF